MVPQALTLGPGVQLTRVLSGEGLPGSVTESLGLALCTQ